MSCLLAPRVTGSPSQRAIASQRVSQWASWWVSWWVSEPAIQERQSVSELCDSKFELLCAICATHLHIWLVVCLSLLQLATVCQCVTPYFIHATTFGLWATRGQVIRSLVRSLAARYCQILFRSVRLSISVSAWATWERHPIKRQSTDSLLLIIFLLARHNKRLSSVRSVTVVVSNQAATANSLISESDVALFAFCHIHTHNVNLLWSLTFVVCCLFAAA